MSILFTDQSYRIVSRLIDYFSSSYGSDGHLKLIQTIDQTMNIYTSRSDRLVKQLKCRHFISRLICSSIVKHLNQYHDGGLYLIILFGHFLLQMRDLMTNELTIFRSSLDLIDRMKIIPVETIDFNSAQPLLALARAVLCKPVAFNSSDLNREQLSLLSVRSFLENITLENSSEQQLILTQSGLAVEHSNLFNGLLYEIFSKVSLSSTTVRPCLLFTVSLAGDFDIQNVDHIESSQQIFQWIQTTAQRIIEQILAYSRLHHGGLILCQKVIHPSIKIQLKNYGIDTLDRLTRQYMPYFRYLTGCQPIETLNFDSLDERYFGNITEIEQMTIGKKHFLQFRNSSRPFHTLFLCATMEQAMIELHECFKATHHVLTSALSSQKAFYGAGCSESMQILFLLNQDRSMARNLLLRTLKLLLRAQYKNRSMIIDRLHGHLWFLSDDDQIGRQCACEIYYSTESFQLEWKNFVTGLDHDDQIENFIDQSNEFFIKQTSAKYFDSFSMKSQTLSIAFETAMNLHLTPISL